MPFDRFLNLLGHLRVEFETDEKKRLEVSEFLDSPTAEEAEALIGAVPAYDDPWHVPGLKPPAWAETETRI